MVYTSNPCLDKLLLYQKQLRDVRVSVSRHLFDINAYVDIYGLRLRGVSWFRSENSDYVQMQREVPEDEHCPDKECVPVAGSATFLLYTRCWLLGGIAMAFVAIN